MPAAFNEQRIGSDIVPLNLPRQCVSHAAQTTSSFAHRQQFKRLVGFCHTLTIGETFTLRFSSARRLAARRRFRRSSRRYLVGLLARHWAFLSRSKSGLVVRLFQYARRELSRAICRLAVARVKAFDIDFFVGQSKLVCATRISG